VEVGFFGADFLMVFSRVMLGEVVCIVVRCGAPLYDEVALFYSVSDPVETHVHCLGASLFDGVIGDAGGGVVVGDN